MTKIVFFQVEEEWEKKKLREAFKEDELLIFEQPIEKVDMAQIRDMEVASVFIHSDCSKNILGKFPYLKHIATRSTGVDHIDLDFCKHRGISVSNVPHYGENTVAEFTFGLILSISRKIIQSYKRVKSGSFSFDGLRGFDLVNKKLGVIGAGSIGKHVISIAKGFGMEVFVYDKYPENNKEFQKQMGYQVVTMDNLLKESDIVSLHVPLNDETKHLISKKEFNKMKDGAIIINTARGGLINSKDLLAALNRGKISFAGIDVVEGEAFIKDELELLRGDISKEHLKLGLQEHMLMNHNKVIMTPHNAFNTRDALERILSTSIKNIKSYKHGGESENKVV